MAHTPGPWVATERSGYHEILAPCEDSDWYGHSKMHAVAYIDTEVDEAEQIADATLISLAPEMLEALEDAVEIIDDQIGYNFPDSLAHFRDVIARAKGGAA